MRPIFHLLAALLLMASVSTSTAQGYRLEKDVDYLDADRKEKADLYLPAGIPAGKRVPAVLIVHGGGWSGGDKFAAREKNIGTNLAQNGYVAMSINYVLAESKGTNVVWPQNLYDCKTAVRWLRKNAERLQIDPDKIGAIGGSAGGHLVSMLALTEAKDGLEPKGPYGEFSSRIQCVVDLYGPINLTERNEISMFRKTRAEAPELYKQASPHIYADKNDPPVLILHGTGDKTVDYRQSEFFAEELKKAGTSHELIIIPEAPHTFHLQPKQRDLRPVVLGFFDKHLKTK
ncbi:MAG: alpha/beta hydrolase fold domain-containing protein [Verrucomicrobiota bacterium]